MRQQWLAEARSLRRHYWPQPLLARLIDLADETCFRTCALMTFAVLCTSVLWRRACIGVADFYRLTVSRVIVPTGAKMASMIKQVLAYDDIVNEPPQEAPDRRPLLNTLSQMPMIGMALLLIAQVADMLGVSQLLRDASFGWQKLTRELWEEFFTWANFSFPYRVSTYEYDLLTYSTLAFSAIFAPLALARLRRKPGGYGRSIWRHYRLATRLPPVRRALWFAAPVVVFAVLFTAFSVQNILEKFSTPHGREFLRKEIWVLIVSDVILLVAVFPLGVASIWIEKLRRFRRLVSYALLYILAYRPVMFAGMVSFMPVEFWSYDDDTKGVSIRIVTTATLLWFVAFVRNWLPFATAAKWVFVIWGADTVGEIAKPWASEIVQHIRDRFDSL